MPPELGAVERSTLVVVAEDLVELDDRGPVLGKPGRESLVQVCARRLRQRLVRGIPDQQVPEAERVVARDHRRARPDELLPHETEQVAVRPGPLRRQRLDGRPVEHLALDRASLERASLRRRQPVDARGEERLDRRRNGDCLQALSRGHREHLFDEQWVALGRVEDPRAQLGRDPGLAREAVDQRLRLPGAERLEQQRRRVQLAARPGRPPVEQVGPGEAEQQDRRIAAPVGHVLDEVEEPGLAPVDVVEHDEQPAIRGGAFE